MPIQYVRDDIARRIRLTVTDPIAVVDLIASVERQLAEATWHYGLLVDMRSQSAAAGPGDIRAFSARVGELVATHGARGPIAVIARDASPIAGAELHLIYGGKRESVEVFWDLDDGQRWLDRMMADA
jgi:hypothetical protein